VITSRHRTLGLLAVVAAILCFSSSSSIVRLAETPGVVIAFWRMLASVVVWQVILRLRGGRTTWAHLRKVAIPGVLFGLNLALFFTAITRTSIAHAEFIGALTPLIMLPAGALIFGETIYWRALSWGTIAVVGIALVIFGGNTSADSVATWQGDLLVVLAMGTWSGYLLTTKRIRRDLDVVEFMAALVPIATLTLMPLALARGGLFDVPASGWWAIALLTILTGTLAHGFIVYAQHAIPVGTISMMQVAQPALAVLWSVVLLGELVSAIQVVGMALVIGGLSLFTWMSQRAVTARLEATSTPVETAPTG
jgi:drug/metabolite transporter (DMT)-like permease